MDSAGGWDSQLASIYRGRRVIVAIDAAAAATPIVESLRRWNVGAVLVVAGARGAGELPDCDFVQLAPTADVTLSRSLQRLESQLLNPSGELRTVVDAFDPAGEALVVSAPFHRTPGLLGRQTAGERRDEWRLLENKTTVESVWSAAGIDVAPSMVVAPDRAPAVAAQLATTLGTVWAADNTHGWHGAGDGTKWVRDEQAASRAAAGFADMSAVRVMPFLDGIPCSIHGIISGDGVAVGRPVEVLILRDLANSEFFYAGAATTWDPPAEVREQMRFAARRVGSVLREIAGYRGAFGIDGVATGDGFFPNELNPRFTGGLHRLDRSIPSLDLAALDMAIVDGDVEVDWRELEDLIVTMGDARRDARAVAVLPTARDQAAFDLARARGRLVVGSDPMAGRVEIGENSNGSFVSVTFEADLVEPGASLAPRAVEALDLASSMWDLGLPGLTPAPDPWRPQISG